MYTQLRQLVALSFDQISSNLNLNFCQAKKMKELPSPIRKALAKTENATPTPPPIPPPLPPPSPMSLTPTLSPSPKGMPVNI